MLEMQEVEPQALGLSKARVALHHQAPSGAKKAWHEAPSKRHVHVVKTVLQTVVKGPSLTRHRGVAHLGLGVAKESVVQKAQKKVHFTVKPSKAHAKCVGQDVAKNKGPAQ